MLLKDVCKQALKNNDYPNLDCKSLNHWCWEFLRRNKKYIEDWNAFHSYPDKINLDKFMIKWRLKFGSYCNDFNPTLHWKEVNKGNGAHFHYFDSVGELIEADNQTMYKKLRESSNELYHTDLNDERYFSVIFKLNLLGHDQNIDNAFNLIKPIIKERVSKLNSKWDIKYKKENNETRLKLWREKLSIFDYKNSGNTWAATKAHFDAKNMSDIRDWTKNAKKPIDTYLKNPFLALQPIA